MYKHHPYLDYDLLVKHVFNHEESIQCLLFEFHYVKLL